MKAETAWPQDPSWGDHPIFGVPLRHGLALEVDGTPVLVAVDLPDTWAEPDQLDADMAEPARSWLAAALAAVEGDFGAPAARAVGCAVAAGEHATSVALLALFLTTVEPATTAVRQARHLRTLPCVVDVVAGGDPDRQVVEARLEERGPLGQVLLQRHGRVLFPAFRTAVVVQLMTPVAGQDEFDGVFDAVLASVTLP